MTTGPDEAKLPRWARERLDGLRRTVAERDCTIELLRKARTGKQVERFAIGTRIDCGDSGEGRITARDEDRVFLESPEYTGWLDEEWLFAQCQPDTKTITLPNGKAVQAKRVCQVSLYPREDDVPNRVFVSVLGGDTQRIDCASAEEAQQVRDRINAMIRDALKGDPA